MPITFERFEETVTPYIEPVVEIIEQQIIPVDTIKNNPESIWLIVSVIVVVLLWLTKPFWGILFLFLRLALITFVIFTTLVVFSFM